MTHESIPHKSSENGAFDDYLPPKGVCVEYYPGNASRFVRELTETLARAVGDGMPVTEDDLKMLPVDAETGGTLGSYVSRARNAWLARGIKDPISDVANTIAADFNTARGTRVMEALKNADPAIIARARGYVDDNGNVVLGFDTRFIIAKRRLAAHIEESAEKHRAEITKGFDESYKKLGLVSPRPYRLIFDV